MGALAGLAALISIHAPLAGCDLSPARRRVTAGAISIHAPLAGCDWWWARSPAARSYFNPRTPCGVRPIADYANSIVGIFQSTHPLRGATLPGLCSCLVWRISIHAPLAGCDLTDCIPPTDFKNFNPRTPCGVRHQRQHRQKRRYRISIHAPLAGCDTSCAAEKRPSGPFQSTHPLRGATRLGGCRARAV